MLRYETLFLAVPEITADEESTIESQLEKVVADAQGSIKSYDRWGKFYLAYPVRNYEYGVYVLMRFEAKPEKKDALLETLRTFFMVKHPDLIMRHVTVKLDPKASLEYQRPESLEEGPTRDVDTFLKENKMSGLLSKSSPAMRSEADDEMTSQE